MDIVQLDKEKYRLGHTLVFFRAGIGGWMEEQRENKIGSVLAWLQSGARGKSSRMQFKKLQDQKLALYACQRALRAFLLAKTWQWLQIWMLIKVQFCPKTDNMNWGPTRKINQDPLLGKASRSPSSNVGYNSPVNV